MGPIFTGYCVYRYKRPISSDFYIILDELRHAYREQDVASSYIYHKELGSRERVARLVCFSAGISSLHVYIAAARRVSWDITSLGLREDNRRVLLLSCGSSDGSECSAQRHHCVFVRVWFGYRVQANWGFPQCKVNFGLMALTMLLIDFRHVLTVVRVQAVTWIFFFSLMKLCGSSCCSVSFTFCFSPSLLSV